MSYLPPPAYAKTLIGRRKLGERVGLLVVGVHDWNAGKALEARPNVARVVVAEDKLPHELDWSCAVALDSLLVGQCPEAVFYATALMLFSVGAASVWGQFDDGLWRLEKGSAKAYRHGLYAAEGPYQPAELATMLKLHREWALLFRVGVYGTKLFDPARVALFDHAFGHLSAKAQAWVAEKQGFAMARVA